MEALTHVLVVGAIAFAIAGGVAKMLYELKKIAGQPVRRRQPWECEPR
jgi:hypothetical protein